MKPVFKLFGAGHSSRQPGGGGVLLPIHAGPQAAGGDVL